MIAAARGFRVGRIFGVEVRLDWSLLIVFWLIVANLGRGLFPLRHPGWSPLLNWGMAAIAAVLFVLSILAHELSHALVGRANGVPVAGITLFIFGGVAHMRGEPRSPRAELLMTVVGPLTSLLIGALALVGGAALAAPTIFDAAAPLRTFQSVGPFAAVLLWLGPINIMIGLFNLIPGFPLDGGRVLRAALWAATRDFTKATRWAAGVGQAFGALLIIAGISMMFGIHIPFLGRGLIPGLWATMIGWFLYGAAAASYSQVVVSDLLEDVAVARLMRHREATLDPELPVANLVDEHLMSTAERAFPVVEGDRLVGIVTLEDVRKVTRAEWPTFRVRDIMTPSRQLSIVTPDDSAAAALAKLSQRDVEQLPVVDQTGHLVGMIRRRDILRWLELQPRPRDARPRERHA